ncbi:MAG: AAA family ATPase [Saprospiraceae bacterium]|nr:AAA family ATPase [Saprospiraceae bacterium]MCF8252619.1 AAA family ATPase [Saprospiraceae bacterium]MCF8282672.1 AAA family ATPase [Bacteroidales bacterium]MCF8314175.1 AAA family ATPase [Saprospiraceae bacterium]MCF8442971.1 AAA family ATPase [Saprospiraceae bacterium]
MGIQIQKIKVENFRSLKKVEVELSKLTLLVGANNAGKTSFLRAMNLALGVEKRAVNRDDLFIDKAGKTISEINGSPQDKITVDVKIIPSENGNRTNEFDENWQAEFGLFIQNEGDQSYFAYRFQYVFEKGKDEAKAGWFSINDWDNTNINEEDDKLNTATLKSISLYFIDAQRDIQDDLKNRTSYFGKLATQIEYEPEALKALESSLATLNEDAVEKAEVLKHLKDLLKELNTPLQSGGKGIEITPLPKKIRDLHKSMKIHFQDGNSEVFGLEYHGMGTRSWASMLTFKAFVGWENSKQSTFHPLLALEEPEAHLHPNAQRHLYSQLSTTAGQKIISTHSPYIAAQAALEEFRYFCKNEDETVVRGLDLSGLSGDALRKIRREVMHSKGELLFSKAVVLSEGETEEQALPLFAAKFWGKEPFELGINFIGCGGSNFEAFIQVFDSLGISWYLFSDYDNNDIQINVNNALKSNGYLTPSAVTNAILLGVSFEDYLVAGGYQEQLKTAIIEHQKPFHSPQHETAKTTEIRGWSDQEIRNYLNAWKTKLSPIYTAEIIKLPEPRNIPTKIRDLFKEIDKKIKNQNADSPENKTQP